MVKGIIGLVILAAIILIWLAKGALKVGRAVYDETVGTSAASLDPELRIFMLRAIEVSTSWGVHIDPYDPKFIGHAREALARRVTPLEMAFTNAVGVKLQIQLANPAPYPNELQLCIADGMRLADEGKVRRELVGGAVVHAEARLKERGLSLS